MCNLAYILARFVPSQFQLARAAYAEGCTRQGAPNGPGNVGNREHLVCTHRIRCNAMLCNAVQQFVCHATLRNAMFCYAMLCDAMCFVQLIRMCYVYVPPTARMVHVRTCRIVMYPVVLMRGLLPVPCMHRYERVEHFSTCVSLVSFSVDIQLREEKMMQ